MCYTMISIIVTRISFLIVLISIFGCFCCGCSSEPEPGTDEPRLPETETGTTETIVVKPIAYSIAQDSIVDAKNTTSLTISYSSHINISQINLITLNDRVVTSATASGNTLVIPLKLESLTHYTIKVLSGALSAGDNTTVNSFTLKFKTKATINLNNIATGLCNVNASKSAKAVYQYFLSIYGKSTVSGVIEPTFNSCDYSSLIQSTTKQLPAIIEYCIQDIHTTSYDDISNITSHQANGGIVAINWQWATPSLENDSPENYSVDSNFNLKNALRDDKWEFQFVENEFNLIAQTLQTLKDNDIVVLFNPMRMAQNHWWGKLDAIYFRELWRLMYDRLAIKHQLNNIIWVWSTESTNLTKDELKKWYPGDEYVDIIGTNSYADNTNSQIDRFLLLNETFEGHKMIAITECGNIPDIPKCHNMGDTWLYFSSMYATNSDETLSLDKIFQLNTTSRWNALLNHQKVITRDEISIFK